MHASSLQSQKWGKMMPALVLGIFSTVMLSPVNLPAQEVDGDFEGEKTWTDKAGNTHDVKADPKALLKDGKVRQALNKILTDGKVSDADDELFESFAQCYVRRLTWKENAATLPMDRRELKKQLIRLGKAPAADLHTRLNSLTLQVCSDVAKDPRYPRAVRINCTLMLAELDEREHNAGTGQAAVSLPAATAALVDLMSDDKQQLFIRLEAMIALMRHIHPGLAPALQTKAVEALVKIIKEPVPEGKELAGQVWLRFRASDLLLAMIDSKLPVDQTVLAESLAELIDDEKLPEWARAVYAGDLGKLEGKSLPAAQSGPAIRALAGLMLAILQASPFMTYEPDEAVAEQPGGTRQVDKKDPKKDSKEEKKAEKADEKKDGKESDKSAPAATAEPLSPSAQKLLSEEMLWQLARIRRALFGKDAPTKDKGPDARLGLHSAASDADKAIAEKVVSDIDKSVKALTEVPDKLDKLADILQTANEDLEDILSGPSETTETATADHPDSGQPDEKVAAGR